MPRAKRPYRGVNILVLWALWQERRYKSGTWATYKQWQELGAQVRKGEKSASVVFWKFFDGEDETESDEGSSSKRIPMVRNYWLFNSGQVDGFQAAKPVSVPHNERVERAEIFFRALGVAIKDGGNGAFYRHCDDAVFMPPFDAFKEALFYYSVLSHETTHWTGAPHRLDRDMTGRFGSEAYAMEELVAELGADFLCCELGLPSDPRIDHAPYIGSWIKVLKNDKRAIFTASAKAQAAVDWMTKQVNPAVEQAA